MARSPTTIVFTPPEVTVEDRYLWPPDRKLVDVNIVIGNTELGDDPSVTVSSDDIDGDGRFSGDVDGQDGYAEAVSVVAVWDLDLEAYVATVSLRAERFGGDRTYTIEVENCGLTDTLEIVCPLKKPK